jgi:thiamine-monophosphate kinase
MAGEDGLGEFETIARLFRPLTGGSPEALDLLDDVAALSGRPGSELVITTDTMVEGVHFLPSEPLDLVARKLLRANLSDLAAKGAEPHGYLLTVAWPRRTGFDAKAQFAAGLRQDQAAFGVRLLGGDTVSTPGPLTVGATLLGWTPAGRLVRRGGARAGDVLLVSGTIGDAGLGLRVLQGGAAELGGVHRDAVVERHRLPTPRLALRDALRRHARAAADVSDGLLADAGHIGEASGLGVEVALERLPLSPAAEAWLARQPDRAVALLDLATAGDDYEVVCTAVEGAVDALQAEAAAAGAPFTVIGRMSAEPELRVALDGRALPLERTGWTHG